ncbi:MAG: NrfD/PsrC family molybdoenzyme membrane anchor subunit [Streptosporangiaceae bacterium]
MPRGERPMVPKADFDSYYGRPVIKPPVWKSPDVPGYLFLGGLAGASAAMAPLAEATGRTHLARASRLAAAGGSVASVGALIHDLGRPERFLNMLRVFKPTSPLSVGSWIIAPFSGLAGAAAAADLSGRLPLAGRTAGVGAGVLGPALSTYTAVLLADTAVPAWHEARRVLPFVFAGSAVTSAAGVGLLAAPAEETGPVRRLAVGGAAADLAATAWTETRLGLAGEPYRQGRAGRWINASSLLTAAGGLATIAAGRSRPAAAVAGLSLLAGAVCTKFGVFEAGRASAQDPAYTVAPQRERLARATGAS